MAKKNEPCPFCNGSNKIITDYDIGSDIGPDGEERQHMDKCGCGAWRFHTEFMSFNDIDDTDGIEGETPQWKSYSGKWNSKDDPWLLENFY
jgi:hypothetical protein